jgi:hypothetical protein
MMTNFMREIAQQNPVVDEDNYAPLGEIAKLLLVNRDGLEKLLRGGQITIQFRDNGRFAHVGQAMRVKRKLWENFS